MKLPPALILAAGQGTRLGELGRRRAKALLPIDGRPLLDLHLEHLAREGVSRVFINAHHHAEQIVEHVARYEGAAEVKVLVEPILLGTAGAAINALPELGKTTFLVVYGDVLIFEPLAPLLRAHAAARAMATLSVYEHPDTRGKGIVEIDRGGTIRRFAEKDRTHLGPGLVNAGLYVIEPALLGAFPARTFLDFGHHVFPAVLRSGGRLHAHVLPHPVLDIGTLDALARASLGAAPPG